MIWWCADVLVCWYVMIAGYHSLAQHTTTPYHKNDVKKKIVEAVLRFAVEAKPWLLAFSVVPRKDADAAVRPRKIVVVSNNIKVKLNWRQF